MERNEADQLLKMMAEIKQAPCILCGDPITRPVLFIPSKPSEYGVKEGFSRIIAYSLCQRCYNTPGAQDKAEAIIKAGSK